MVNLALVKKISVMDSHNNLPQNSVGKTNPSLSVLVFGTINVAKARFLCSDLDDCYVDLEYILYKVITAKCCGSLYAVTFALTLIP